MSGGSDFRPASDWVYMSGAIRWLEVGLDKCCCVLQQIFDSSTRTMGQRAVMLEEKQLSWQLSLLDDLTHHAGWAVHASSTLHTG